MRNAVVWSSLALTLAACGGGGGPPAPSENASLATLAVSAGTLTPAFDPATTDYGVGPDILPASVTCTPTAEDAAATITVNGQACESGAASAPVALNMGATIVTLIVTAEDGATEQTYTVTFDRAIGVIAEVSWELAGGTNRTYDSLPLQFGYPIPPGDPTWPFADLTLLWDGIVLNASDVGTLLTATSNDNPEFDTIAGLVTNGLDETIYWNTDVGFGSFPPESIFFDPQFNSGIPGAPDLIGFDITRIELRIDDIEFTTPGISGGTDAHVWMTIKYIGLPSD